jgi:methionine sulfoxide reductase heme-binding subunit
MDLSVSFALTHAALTTIAATTTSNPVMWYATRTAAISAYVALSATAALGMCRSLVRVAHVRNPRTLWLLDVAHPYLALITAAFVALHLISLVLDPLIPFSPLNLLLPIAEPYRPLASGLGVLALYALLVVWLSSWLRRYIAYARWKTLHYTSFIAFVMVTAHGLLAGTDAGEGWMRAVYLAAAGVVLALGGARMFWPTQRSPRVA